MNSQVIIQATYSKKMIAVELFCQRYDTPFYLKIFGVKTT